MGVPRLVISPVLVITCALFSFTQEQSVNSSRGGEQSKQVLSPSTLRDVVRRSKTICVAIYYGPQPGVVTDPPGEDVDAVIAALTAWPLTTTEDAEVIRNIKAQLREWGRFVIASDPSHTDLLVVVDRGINTFVDAVCNPTRSEKCFSGLIHRDGSVSVYATAQKPGLIWRKPQPARTQNAEVNLIQTFKKDVESGEPSEDGRTH
jgi:hypothetical protein